MIPTGCQASSKLVKNFFRHNVRAKQEKPLWQYHMSVQKDLKKSTEKPNVQFMTTEIYWFDVRKKWTTLKK